MKIEGGFIRLGVRYTMPTCTVIRNSGYTCDKPAYHTYNGRQLCEKHWNDGCLTWAQPHEEVVEARRRIQALREMPVICELVLKAVVRNPRMSFNRMAEMAHQLGLLKGHLTRNEAHQVSLLIVNTVKLNRRCTKANEHIAFRLIGGMIQDICS
jgi:hypothetical protein